MDNIRSKGKDTEKQKVANLIGHQQRNALLEEHVRRLRVTVQSRDVHQRRSVLCTRYGIKADLNFVFLII